MNRKLTIILACISILLAGCEKFEPTELHMTELYDGDKTVTCTVTITNNGGCSNFSEQGGIVSFSNNPSHLDQYSVVEVIYKNSTELIYSFTRTLPIADTTYFLRAFVKTNAGTGYSNIIAVKTRTPEEL